MHCLMFNKRIDITLKNLTIKNYDNLDISQVVHYTMHCYHKFPCPTVILGSVFFLGVSSWVNHYDAPFTFTCPQHQSISRVRSHQYKGAEDRVFGFQCKQYTSDSESCHWSGETRDKMLFLFKNFS